MLSADEWVSTTYSGRVTLMENAGVATLSGLRWNSSCFIDWKRQFIFLIGDMKHCGHCLPYMVSETDLRIKWRVTQTYIRTLRKFASHIQRYGFQMAMCWFTSRIAVHIKDHTHNIWREEKEKWMDIEEGQWTHHTPQLSSCSTSHVPPLWWREPHLACGCGEGGSGCEQAAYYFRSIRAGQFWRK